MTTISLEINDDSYLLEHLTYDPETKVIKKITERVGDWKKSPLQVPRRVRALPFHKKHLLQPATKTNEEYKPSFRVNQIKKLYDIRAEPQKNLATSYNWKSSGEKEKS